MGARSSPPAPAPVPPPAPAPAAAPGGKHRPGAPAAGPPSRPLSPGGADLWRRWRGPLVLAGLILLGGTVIALLQPAAVVTGYLDPAGTGPNGAHALADLLGARGVTVTRAITPAAAEAAAAGTGPGGVTLVVTSPGLLTARQLAGLARVPGDRVLIGPDQAALTALAPAVRLRGQAPVQALPPGCGLAAARLAGNAGLGGLRLAIQPAAAPAGPQPARGRTRRPALCYPTRGSATLVQYAAAGRVITVLGTGNPLANGSLAQLGNAALALNLLQGRSRVVWLVPGPGLLGAGSPRGPSSLPGLIPLPAYLVAIQLGVAVLLAAAWRARRLGPLVPEPLPVVVRASETAEGHAGLYRARRARGQAATALRTAMLARTLPALGLAPGARPGDVVPALSARSARDPAGIEAIVFGPAPGDDAALVALADDLDALEREVRTQ